MALAISGIPMLTGDEALAFREKAEEICKLSANNHEINRKL